ncbi:MAG: sigma 54-interacting transcriptional regulator, partial [Sphingobium sp.]
MMAIARTVERVAPTDLSVMLMGASGAGKGLVARALHDASPRRGGPFVTLNCAAMLDTMPDGALFEHEVAFADAAGGTLFLDEVGDIPPALQARLISSLADRHDATKARIICATHRDMGAMMATGAFRDDLYHRLAEMTVRIPALAERTGDPILLARHFLTRHGPVLNPAITGFSPDALAAIDGWSWPGNVRELDNRVKRAVIMAEGKMIVARDLDLPGGEGEADSAVINLKAAREQADRRAIRHALSRTDGNISNAARMLGISRPTLYELIKNYDLTA